MDKLGNAYALHPLTKTPERQASPFRRGLNWLGGRLVKVPPHYTSQTCTECGHVSKENRKGTKFLCLKCGHETHADVNAAKNILAAGLAVIACGEYLDVTDSMKQEPTGGNYAFA